jgi:hypothetical protein
MIYQDPHPAFEKLNSLGFNCRRFEITPGMLD